MLLLYEALRDLRVREDAIDTPLETTGGMRLADDIVVIAILRAGLGMTDGALRLIPEARVGHLGIYRDEAALQPVGYYESIPGTRRRRDRRRRPDARHGRERGARAERIKRDAVRAAALRLPGRRARGAARVARGASGRARRGARRSTASSTSAGTSGRGSAMRGTGSSGRSERGLRSSCVLARRELRLGKEGEPGGSWHRSAVGTSVSSWWRLRSDKLDAGASWGESRVELGGA